MNTRVLSCIKPTGGIHLGNYFGAIRQWVAMQENYQCLFGVVDLHAMTIPYQPDELKHRTDQYFLDLLACGMNPQQSKLFVQSLIPEHIELAWILSTITPFGELRRQAQFKEMSQKLREKQRAALTVSTGLFTYPILQAADILIYRAQFVPVGEDQMQHLELTRHIAERFNKRYDEFFPIPEAKKTDTPKIYSLANPDKKMSKSLGEKHYIGLFEAEEDIRRKIKSAKTDSGLDGGEAMSRGVFNLFQILRACDKVAIHDNLMEDYQKGQLAYSHLKDAVSDAVIELTRGLKAKRADLEKDRSLLYDVIREMSKQARKMAQETLFEVKERVGIKSISYF